MRIAGKDYKGYSIGYDLDSLKGSVSHRAVRRCPKSDFRLQERLASEMQTITSNHD